MYKLSHTIVFFQIFFLNLVIIQLPVVFPKIFIAILSSNTFSNKIYLPPKDIPGLTENSQQFHIGF